MFKNGLLRGFHSKKSHFWGCKVARFNIVVDGAHDFVELPLYDETTRPDFSDLCTHGVKNFIHVIQNRIFFLLPLFTYSHKEKFGLNQIVFFTDTPNDTLSYNNDSFSYP